LGQAAALDQTVGFFKLTTAIHPAERWTLTLTADATVPDDFPVRFQALVSSSIVENVATVQGEAFNGLHRNLLDVTDLSGCSTILLTQLDTLETHRLSLAWDGSNAVLTVEQLVERETVEIASLVALVELVATLNQSQFTPSTWAAVAQAAAEAAQWAQPGTPLTPGKAEQLETALTTALGNLVIVANKSGLLSALTLANQMLANSGAYQPSTIAGLPAVRDAAQAVYDNPEATQDQVTAARTLLLAEIAKAKPRS
jgi:hypothetical protein